MKGGARVRVLDDNSRGRPRRLAEVEKDIEFIGGDIRDAVAVEKAMQGMDEVHHLAFVNGTEFFYMTDQYYAPGQERGVRFDDPKLGIDWPLPPRDVADRDRQWPLL